jgi:hypothetical protein
VNFIFALAPTAGIQEALLLPILKTHRASGRSSLPKNRAVVILNSVVFRL